MTNSRIRISRDAMRASSRNSGAQHEVLSRPEGPAKVKPTEKKSGGNTAVAKRRLRGLPKDESIIRSWGRKSALEMLDALSASGRRQLLRRTIGEADAVRRFRADREVTLGTIRRAVRDKRLVALRGGNGELRFPIWQFRKGGGVILGLREVMTALPLGIINDDVGIVAFFLNPNPLTAGNSPIRALRAGKVDQVLSAAFAARF